MWIDDFGRDSLPYLDGLGDGTTGIQADPPSTASHDPRLFTNGSLMFIWIPWFQSWGLDPNDPHGYGSIPIHSIFSGLFTSINPSYLFWGSRHGTRVLTHPHMFLYIFCPTSRRTKTSSTWTAGSCSPAKVPRRWCQGCGGWTDVACQRHREITTI